MIEILEETKKFIIFKAPYKAKGFFELMNQYEFLGPKETKRLEKIRKENSKYPGISLEEYKKKYKIKV